MRSFAANDDEKQFVEKLPDDSSNEEEVGNGGGGSGGCFSFEFDVFMKCRGVA